MWLTMGDCAHSNVYTALRDVRHGAYIAYLARITLLQTIIAQESKSLTPSTQHNDQQCQSERVNHT